MIFSALTPPLACVRCLDRESRKVTWFPHTPMPVPADRVFCARAADLLEMKWTD